MARQLGQSLSKTVAFVRCSWSAVVSIYQKWSKEGTVVNRRQEHGLPRLTDACGKRRLARVVQYNRQATVAQTAEEVDAGSDREVYTQCIAGCCVWGCKARHADPLSTLKVPNNGQVSIRTGPQSDGRRWPSLMFSFTSRGWPGVCTLLTWETLGTRMHSEKKANWQRQCDALGNVLQGNLWSCHPCRCYFDM